MAILVGDPAVPCEAFDQPGLFAHPRSGFCRKTKTGSETSARCLSAPPPSPAAAAAAGRLDRHAGAGQRLGGDAPTAFVPFPPSGLIAALPEDVAVTGRSPVSLTLQSDGPDLAVRLYAAGAWLVLPAGLEACIPAFLRQRDE